METVKGTVKKIIYHNEDSGFKVMKVRLPAGPIITVTGEFGPEVIQGTKADFHGDYKSHSKYGNGFRALSFNITHNIEELESVELFIDNISPNIGPERAHLIVKYFGDRIIDILDNEPIRLTEVEGIGRVSAKSLAEAWELNRNRWKEERQEYTLRVFLNSLGIREKRVKKILKYFGGPRIAEERIRENPYILTEIERFGFSTADFIARKLGVHESDPLRIVAFIQYILNVMCPSNGHLYLNLGDILESIHRYCRENNTLFLNKSIITASDIAKHLKDLIENDKIIRDENVLYSKQCYFSETLSALKISTIIKTKSLFIFLNKETVSDHINIFEFKSNLTLSEEQKKALYYFIDKKVYAITGLPGTGKTLVLKALVSLIKKLKLKLTLMAPTGISAKKMASTIGYEAFTIHRRLGFRGDSWRFGEKEKYETDVVIIDESSMIDQEVFYRLLAALHSHVRLIFVGDNNQLPSVGAGNVLKELITCNQIPIIKLEQIFRQDEASDIIKVAHRIKNGNTDLSLFKSDPKADVFFIRESNIEIIKNYLIQFAQKFKDKKRAFQIITPRNDGPLSVNELNSSLQAVLNPPGIEDERQLGKFIVRRGDRIIITKNDYELNVFNGEVGKVIEIDSSGFLIDLSEKIVHIGFEQAMGKMKLAYSLTVHRCINPNTFITTPNGLVRMGQLKKNSEIYQSKKETQRVLWHGSTGTKILYRIKTERGYYVESSENHKFLIADNNKEAFIKTKDIKTGMCACINRDEIKGKHLPLIANNIRGSGITPRKDIKLPKYLTEDIAWLLGSLIGKGCYTDKFDGTVKFSHPKHIEVLSEFGRIISTLELNPRSHYKKEKLDNQYVCSKNFKVWLYSIGYNYVTSEDKDIPELIFKADLPCKLSFLAGLIDSDGSVSEKGLIRYVTVSSNLVHNMQLLLLSCGIVSSITESKSTVENESDKYNLSIDMNHSYTFYRLLKCDKKRDRLKNTSIVHPTTNRKIPYGKRLVIEFFSLLNSKKTRGVKGQELNTPKYKRVTSILEKVKYGRNNLTYNFLEKMINILKEKRIPIPAEFTSILSKYTLYDKIRSIEYLKIPEETQDMEIECKHEYIANGFISHNSQGQEYPYIILPFVNDFGKHMLQRNLLYTAITRAKEKVIVIGHGSALEKAINNSSVQRRNTKLGERIKLCLQKPKKDFLPTLHGEQVDSHHVISKKEPPL